MTITNKDTVKFAEKLKKREIQNRISDLTAPGLVKP
jgi:hypothetical protein